MSEFVTGEWSKEEVEFLKKNAGRMKNEEIAKALNRKYESVRKKACTMNLTNFYWTKEQEDYLTKYYGIKPMKTLMNVLHKSKYQIRRKMVELESTCDVNLLTSGFSTTDICEILGVGKTTVYRWANEKKIPNIRISKGIIVYPEEAFWKWLKNNLDKPIYHKIDDSILNVLPEWFENEVRKNKRSIIKNKYNKQYEWTRYETTTLLNMRSKGFTFREIGDELGRSGRSVSSKYYELMKKEHNKVVSA